MKNIISRLLQRIVLGSVECVDIHGYKAQLKPDSYIFGYYEWDGKKVKCEGLLEWSNDHMAFVIKNEVDVFYLGELSNIEKL